PVLVVAALESLSVAEACEIPPGIAAEELVAARAGEDDLDELARESCDIEVRVGLADAQVLEAPDERRQDPFHVARVQDDLVVLRSQRVRELLRTAALVEAELEAGDRGQNEPGR